VNFQLIESDIDTILATQPVDGAVQLIHCEATIAQLAHIEAQFMIQRAGAEGGEEHRRLRIVHHFWMLHRRLQQHFFHLIQIRTVSNADTDNQPRDGIGERPVDQPLGNKRFVRNDHFFAVKIGDCRRANTDLVYRPGEGADGYRIANAYRAFKQNDQARDEVPEDLLKTKAEAHRQGGGQPL